MPTKVSSWPMPRRSLAAGIWVRAWRFIKPLFSKNQTPQHMHSFAGVGDNVAAKPAGSIPQPCVQGRGEMYALFCSLRFLRNTCDAHKKCPSCRKNSFGRVGMARLKLIKKLHGQLLLQLMQHLVARQHLRHRCVGLAAFADGGEEFAVLQLNAVDGHCHLGDVDFFFFASEQVAPGRWRCRRCSGKKCPAGRRC